MPDSETAPRPLLDLDSVSMTYRSASGAVIDVFNGVSACVRQAELVLVSGRSGSGKTTLLRIASGLLRPEEGTVRWNGVPIDDLDRAQLIEARARHLGIVFQGATLIDMLTAAENVAVAGVPMGAPNSARSRALELIGELGLSTRAGHFPRQLSGGEQQRVAIRARCLRTRRY